MHTEVIDLFKAYYGKLPPENMDKMNAFYAEDIRFQDPIRKMSGMQAVRNYHQNLVSSVKDGGYKYTQQTILHDKAYLSWELEVEFNLPRKCIQVSGITVLILAGKIISHRNYYDAGAMFYENLPLLGPVVRTIKRQLSKRI